MTIPRKLVVQGDHVGVLQHFLRVGGTECRAAYRARILLLRGEGLGASAVAERVGCDPATVWRVESRYRREGLQALHDRPRPGRPRTISPAATGAKLVVQEGHVEVLQRFLRLGRTERRAACRARILLLRKEGLRPSAVAEQVGCSLVTVWRVERRYRRQGLRALRDRPRPGRPRTTPPTATGASGRVGVSVGPP